MTADAKRTELRHRADLAREFVCRNLIAVLENPKNIRNIGSVVRNVNALGIEKTYVIDGIGALPGDWEEMRERKSMKATSASAIKWSFVKRFDNTQMCLEHLEKNRFTSIGTSPHMKGEVSIDLDVGDFTRYKRLAVWFGSEARGLSNLALSNCDFCVRVPMYGIVESLNLGTTSGIVLYEIAKQWRLVQRKRRKGRARAKLAQSV